MGTCPLVHVGFLKSWLAGGLKDKVLASVLKAVQHCQKRLAPSQKVTVFVTGAADGLPAQLLIVMWHCPFQNTISSALGQFGLSSSSASTAWQLLQPLGAMMSRLWLTSVHGHAFDRLQSCLSRCLMGHGSGGRRAVYSAQCEHATVELLL